MNRQDAKGAKVERFQISVFSFQFLKMGLAGSIFSTFGRWQDFDDAGEQGVFPDDQVIVAPKQDFATGRLRKKGEQRRGGHAEEPLRLASEGEAGGVENETIRGLSLENLRTKRRWKQIEVDFDKPVFDGRADGGGVEGDLPEIAVVELPGPEHREVDRIAVEAGECGCHVTVMDQELAVWLRDLRRRKPSERRLAKLGTVEEWVELRWENGGCCFHGIQ